MPLAAVLLIGVSAWSWRDDHWHSAWAVALAIGALAYSVNVARKIHWSAGLALIAALLSGLWVFAWRENQYQSMNALSFMALAWYSGGSAVALLLVTLPALLARGKVLCSLEAAIGWLCLANSLAVLFDWARGAPFNAGLFGNPSISASLIGFTYPFLAFRPASSSWWRGRWWQLWDLACSIIPIVAAIATGSSMGLVGIGAAIAAYLLAFDYQPKRAQIRAAAALAIAATVGAWTLGPDLVSDSGRIRIWQLMFEWWTANANPFFGTGLGTYTIISQHVQQTAKQTQGGLFIFMHNDWLQVLFEQGIVGLASVSLLFGSAIARSFRERPHVFAALASFGIAAAGNFPLHYPVHAFIGAVILRLSFERERVF